MKRNGIDVKIFLEPHLAIFGLLGTIQSSVIMSHDVLAACGTYLMGYHQQN